METAEASSLVSSEAAAVDSLGHYVAATTETPPRPVQPFLEPEPHIVNSEGARAFSPPSDIPSLEASAPIHSGNVDREIDSRCIKFMRNIHTLHKQIERAPPLH